MKSEERNLSHFFKNVVSRLGFHDWSLRIVSNSSEGYCWENGKTIDVGMKNNCPRRLILHEVAHIGTCRFCNNRHHVEFWRRFEDLMRRFLPKMCIQPRYNENSGYFRKCYDK